MRLLALQMLAAGHTRAETREQLIAQFKIAHPDEVLDELGLQPD